MPDGGLLSSSCEGLKDPSHPKVILVDEWADNTFKGVILYNFVIFLTIIGVICFEVGWTMKIYLLEWSEGKHARISAVVGVRSGSTAGVLAGGGADTGAGAVPYNSRSRSTHTCPLLSEVWRRMQRRYSRTEWGR